MTGVDHGATIRQVLADCGVKQESIAHTAWRGTRVAFRVRIAPLTVNPQGKCEQLQRHFASAGMPCGVTWGTGLDGEELRITVVPTGQTQ